MTVGGKNIQDVSRLSIEQAQEFFDKLTLDEEQTIIAAQILKEIKARLQFMVDVGLGYLTLDRTSAHPLRRRGPADPPGHAGRQRPGRASATCSTSRPSACTSATTTGCSAPSSG